MEKKYYAALHLQQLISASDRQIIDAAIAADNSMKENLYPVQDRTQDLLHRRQTLYNLATEICSVLGIIQYCFNRATHTEALDKRLCSTANYHRIYSG